jgi:hypothetical protein
LSDYTGFSSELPGVCWARQEGILVR